MSKAVRSAIRRQPKAIIQVDRIQRSIIVLRNERMILDFDLAELYGVEPKDLKRAVRRNINRFPSDFMIELTDAEHQYLRRQSGTSSYGGRRYRPYAFTEQGVAMLSSVLRSPRAVKVNVEIMRAFVRLRKMLIEHRDLARRIDLLEQQYSRQFRAAFDAIRDLMTEVDPPAKPPIGFQTEVRKAKPPTLTRSAARAARRLPAP